MGEALATLRATIRKWSRADRKRILEAADAAQQAHLGQFRASGEPYVVHPILVAAIVASSGGDTATVIGALLHDTVEDTPVTLDDIERQFGPDVRNIVDGCTKVAEVRVSGADALEAARMRKLLVALARDTRVLVVKSADRLHNMRTIAHLPEAKQRRIGQETLALYGPLAGRVGLTHIKAELEDRAFAVADPQAYAAVQAELHTPELRQQLDSAMSTLSNHLRASGINGSLSGRIKMPWSAYRKAQSLGIPVHELHDLIGLRVIVPTVRDCYVALGAVHSLWGPAEGRFKDYIARPKFNRYQSLHSSVLGEAGTLIEVQIRTPVMHAEAEHGRAAHRSYKNADPDEPAWLRRLLDDHDEEDGEYLHAVHRELSAEDEILISTPNGDTHILPAGATVIDFAYAVHTAVGNACTAGEVNGLLTPATAALHTGDRVHVLTGRDGPPPAEWLNYAVTRKARTGIKAARRRGEQAAPNSCVEARDHDPDLTLELPLVGILPPDATRQRGNERALLEVLVADRTGILADLASAITQAGGNIVFSSTTVLPDHSGRDLFDVACAHDQRRDIADALEEVPGVTAVNFLD